MHPIENIIDSSIDQIKKMVDVSTVIGDPVVTANETLILPVSKVCIGFVVGGGEYGRMATAKKQPALQTTARVTIATTVSPLPEQQRSVCA